MKAQNPKKKEKERNNNNNNKGKRRGSRAGQRIGSKKKDPSQARGYVARIINIKALGSWCVLLKPWEEDLGWHMGKSRCMFRFPAKNH